MKTQRHVAGAFLVLLGAVCPAAAQRIWDGGGADEKWSTALNWSGNAVPNNEVAQFDDTAGAGRVTLVDAGFGNALSGLYFYHTAGTHTADLQGNTLRLNASSPWWTGRNVGRATAVIQGGTLVAGKYLNWRTGEREGGVFSGRGSLTLSGVRLLTDEADCVIVGRNMDLVGWAHGALDLSGTTAGSRLHVRNASASVVGYGHCATGVLTLSASPLATNGFGFGGTLTEFHVGNVADKPNEDGQTTEGRFDAGGGVFHGRHSYFIVGHNDQATGAAVGSADYRGVAPASTLDTYGWDTRIGVGRQAAGRLTLGPNIRAGIGQSRAERVNVGIGSALGRNGTGMATTGAVDAAGAEFHLHGGYLDVGLNEGSAGMARGRLDLSAAAPGSTLDTYGWETRVGVGREAAGTLTLNPNVRASIGQSGTERVNLGIGNSQGRNADGMTTTGLVDAAGAEFHLHGGYLDVGLNEGSAGTARGRLDLSAAAPGSTLDTYGWETRVGVGREAAGTLTLNPNVRASIGQSGTERVNLGVGNSQGRNADGMTTTGLVDAAGAEFHLHGGYLDVGLNEGSAGTAHGRLDLSAAAPGSTLDTYGWETRVGCGRQAAGTLLIGPGMRTSIGQSAAQCVSLSVGNSGSRNAIGMASTGTVLAAGGVFNLHGAYVFVGVNPHTAGAAAGLVDLRGATGGVLRTYGWETRIGFGRDADGTLALGASTDTWGAAAGRPWLRIGENDGKAGTLTRGVLTKCGGSVDAWFSHIFVGHNGADADATVIGTLDLAGATFGTNGIDAVGEVRIGYGKNATGTVRLPAGRLQASGLVMVGDDDTGARAGGSGLLELNGTVAAVARCLVYASGTVTARVGRLSVGLNLVNSDPAQHSVTNLTVVFCANPDPDQPHHYGFRIAGSHAAWLSGLTNSGAIRVERAALHPKYRVEVFADAGYTMLGVRGPLEPPPSTTAAVLQVR